MGAKLTGESALGIIGTLATAAEDWADQANRLNDQLLAQQRTTLQEASMVDKLRERVAKLEAEKATLLAQLSPHIPQKVEP
jgi:hypothetical protein